jgi:quercetin dioxygenase-like cupin family protein
MKTAGKRVRSRLGAETGQATISMLFTPNGPRTFSGAYVTFQPGARSAWNDHLAGQTLVVTEGSGWVQLEGEEGRDLKPGDVVWTPPNVRHWHGAAASASMTHVALQGVADGTAVHWFEHVTDAQLPELNSCDAEPRGRMSVAEAQTQRASTMM